MKTLKEIGWYKSTKGRGGGCPKQVEVYHAVRSNGTIKAVDITRGTVRTNGSFGSIPITTLEICSKEDFHRAMYQVISK